MCLYYSCLIYVSFLIKKNKYGVKANCSFDSYGGSYNNFFAVNIYALIALFIIILFPLSLKIIGKKVNNTLLTTRNIYSFHCFVYFYLLYIGNGFDTIVVAVYQLFIDVFVKKLKPSNTLMLVRLYIMISLKA